MQWGLQLSLPHFRCLLNTQRQRVGSILQHLCADSPAHLLPMLHLQDPELHSLQQGCSIQAGSVCPKQSNFPFSIQKFDREVLLETTGSTKTPSVWPTGAAHLPPSTCWRQELGNTLAFLVWPDA